MDLAPRQERAILDEIRNDRDLIARLRITPKELEALSKCALLGTLTCKQDMLFILRQIREAGVTSIDPVALVPQPAALEEDQEEPGPELPRRPVRSTPTIIPEPGSLDSIVRRRRPEQFGVLFWAVVLVGGLVWNGIVVMSRWRGNLSTTFGTATSAAPAADTWYSQLDRFSVLFWWELLFVAVMVALTYVRSRRGSRPVKIRQIRRSR
ncbi:MAG: hypothetical protein WCA22_13295 [Candidatus Binatus sp.]